jgi:uncharacterized protein (DUF362 family)/Pyruvate/2-oxoacid:ferredoxin oxidoreductase delta subunit
MADVSLLRCMEYSLERLKELMTLGLAQVHAGPEGFRSLRVVLKPNLLSAAAPDSGVVTHPVFFQAAAELVLDHGGRPVMAESPSVASLGSALKATGYDAVLHRLGIEVADLSDVAKLQYPQARVFKSFEIARAFFDADLVLNLPKFKTHALTHVTAAVKNLFGAVPGLRKSQLHLKCPSPGELSEAILDLYGAFLHGFEPARPLVHVMDAVVALEGEGPGTSGRPRPMNAVITGTDGLAVDWVAVQVSGLDPKRCPIPVGGLGRGYGIASGSEVRVLGQDVDGMRVQGFVPPSGGNLSIDLLGVAPVRSVMRRLFTGRPVPVPGACSRCLQCLRICPAKAIAEPGPGGAAPVFDYGRCIRCWCCSEACPSRAIAVRKGALQWLTG